MIATNVDVNKLIEIARLFINQNHVNIDSEHGTICQSQALHAIVTAVVLHHVSGFGLGSHIRCLLSIGDCAVDSVGVLKSEGTLFTLFTTINYDIITIDWHDKVYTGRTV